MSRRASAVVDDMPAVAQLLERVRQLESRVAALEARPATIDPYESALLMAIADATVDSSFSSRELWSTRNQQLALTIRDCAGTPRELGDLLARHAGCRIGRLVLKRIGKRECGVTWVFVNDSG